MGILIPQISAYRRQKRLGPLEPCQRPHQVAHSCGIASGVVNAADVRIHHGFVIVDCTVKRDVSALVHRLWPSSPAYQPCHVVKAAMPPASGRKLSSEKCRQRDGPFGISGFPKAHGSHSQPGYASSPRMEHRVLGPFFFSVIRRNGRSGQNEMPDAVGVVHMKTDGIPEFWSYLPFVDETGRVSFQKFPYVRRGLCQIAFQRIGIRHVEHAFGNLFASCRLATPLWPFDQNGTGAGQAARELSVGDTFAICCCLFHGADTNSSPTRRQCK